MESKKLAIGIGALVAFSAISSIGCSKPDTNVGAQDTAKEIVQMRRSDAVVPPDILKQKQAGAMGGGAGGSGKKADATPPPGSAPAPGGGAPSGGPQ